MKEMIQAIAHLVEALDRFRVGAYIFLITLFSMGGAFIWYTDVLKLSKIDNTNTVAINQGVANKLDAQLQHIADETESNIVGIAIYVTDPKYEELYITFIRQVTTSGVYPIPNTKYFLSTNNLYKRYLEHKKGICFKRSFEDTDSEIAISCPLFTSDKELLGYYTVEYTVSKPSKPLSELILQVSNYRAQLEKLTAPELSYMIKKFELP